MESNDFEFRIRVNEKPFFDRSMGTDIDEESCPTYLLMNKQQLSEMLTAIFRNNRFFFFNITLEIFLYSH